MSRKKPRVPRTRALGFVPTPTESASEQVRLGLRLRNEANVTGRCACGATRRIWEIRDDGTLVEVALPQHGRVHYVRFEHEDDCPAISPLLDAALERGEVSDPGGDLLAALRGEDDPTP